MTTQLRISLGQYSDKGRKPINQDFHAALVPHEPLMSTKGIVVALADGISSSDVSQIASETAVKGVLEDYYATPESWSVKTSARRVLHATNSWLYAQTRNGPYRYDINRGYVCTLSALILKSTTAHIFHAGDSRVYRLQGDKLEPLTEDHRLYVSRDKHYLNRALGMRDGLDIDYCTHTVSLGDSFILVTDGVYESVPESSIVAIINDNPNNLNLAAEKIVAEAYCSGSSDNLSIQIVRIDELPNCNISELQQHSSSLPFPPDLQPRMKFDGYEILRELHHSSRSHVYLAMDMEKEKKVVLKTPSTDLRNDADYLERFLMEEWVARRIDNVHILKPCEPRRKRSHLYFATEFIDGQNLSQWIIDNPKPDIETVRNIVEQIARGLYALHRNEMLHQDLRPNNIMIDKTGTVKIIDFGAVRIAGLSESSLTPTKILGTVQYTAPEYFIGEEGTTRSDLFSLGVITYQMLSGQMPYGTQVSMARSIRSQRNLVYKSILNYNHSIPEWIDAAIKKAVHPRPYMRHEEISEFIHDLRQPSRNFLNKSRPPLIERNPVLVWKSVSLLLMFVILLLLTTREAIQ